MKFSELNGITKEHKKLLLDMFAQVYGIKGKTSNSITVLSKEYVPCRNRFFEPCFNTAFFRFNYGTKDTSYNLDLCEKCLNGRLNDLMGVFISTFSKARKRLEEKYKSTVNTRLHESQGVEQPFSGDDVLSLGDMNFQVTGNDNEELFTTITDPAIDISDSVGSASLTFDTTQTNADITGDITVTDDEVNTRGTTSPETVLHIHDDSNDSDSGILDSLFNTDAMNIAFDKWRRRLRDI